MELVEAIGRRRMVRNYDPDRDVSRETVRSLLELAVHAPSAGFSQGWHFLVLDTTADRGRYWAATADPDREPDRWLQGMQSAPVLVVALSDPDAYLDRYAEADKGWADRDENRWPIPYWDVDTGMAALLLLLGAVDADLGACFFGVPGQAWPALREEFSIPPRLRPVGVVSLGYRRPDPRSPSLRRGRRPLDDVVSWGSMPSA